MGRILKRLVDNQKGQALALVLCFLALGGLTIATLLTYMTTGIKAGQIQERKMNEFYAADAGIELAMWNLMNGEIQVLYGESLTLDQFTVNTKTVDVTVYNTGSLTFRITSVATSANRPSTTIKAYAIAIPGFFDNDFEVFEEGNFQLGPGESYEGNIWVNNGNVQLDLSGNLTGHVYTENGNIQLKAGAQITGNIYAKNGNVQLEAGAVIIGHICSLNGNVQLNGEGAYIRGNVYAMTQVQLVAGSTIDGDVYYGDQLVNNGTITGATYDFYPGCPMCEASSDVLSWKIQ